MVLLYYHNESTAYLKCHQNNSGLISMGAKAKQRFGVHVRRFGGVWCTHGTGESLITSSQKSSQIGGGLGMSLGLLI